MDMCVASYYIDGSEVTPTLAYNKLHTALLASGCSTDDLFPMWCAAHRDTAEGEIARDALSDVVSGFEMVVYP